MRPTLKPRILPPLLHLPIRLSFRTYATTTNPPQPKPEGDISSVFVSLSGTAAPPLPPRFASLKDDLIRGHEDKLRGSWEKLLSQLREETRVIRELGSRVVPEIRFEDIASGKGSEEFGRELRKRGVAVVRGVVSEEEALGWKEEVIEYVRANPQTKAFPPTKPAVYELYWSPPQIRARAHPNLLRTQRFLMSHWHSTSPTALLSTAHPTGYADRLRIRQPGDSGFALGPHVDGGSCERWERDGYGRGGVYDAVFAGDWEDYDPWEASRRLSVVSDLYNGAGACSMFRMFQGWLSMSRTGPGEGTLLVNPLLASATAYFLLRPFFEPVRGVGEADRGVGEADRGVDAFLSADNWRSEERRSPMLQGATPSHCQELSGALHPHLNLDGTMVHVPEVGPGDYVAWHCDTIHAVDKVHAGTSDSSVMYIPCCPLTEKNAEYLVRQRHAFSEGRPPPDFPGGKGESEHVGRLSVDYVMRATHSQAQRAMGLAKWNVNEEGISTAQKGMLEKANEILRFA